MKYPAIKTLGQRGFSHIILPVVVMIGVGAIGGLVIVKSHADTISPNVVASPNSIQSKQVSQLTQIIQQLNNGISANITVDPVTVAGSVGDAQARPIVFTLYKQTYFAYRQGTAPDFSTTARKTAQSMAITKATGSPALEQAHIDKGGNLVDSDESNNLVGYSVDDGSGK